MEPDVRGDDPRVTSDQVAANKALLLRLNDDVINGGDVAVLDELFAPDVEHARRGMVSTFRRFGPTTSPGDLSPRERFARGYQTIHSAFPDWYTTIEEQIGEGDVVVERMHVAGTHRGEFLGIPPTGRRVELTEVVMFTIRDGRVVKIWGISNEVDLWEQLGVLVSGPAASTAR
jgi:predicted ester cyclase